MFDYHGTFWVIQDCQGQYFKGERAFSPPDFTDNLFSAQRFAFHPDAAKTFLLLSTETGARAVSKHRLPLSIKVVVPFICDLSELPFKVTSTSGPTLEREKNPRSSRSKRRPVQRIKRSL